MNTELKKLIEKARQTQLTVNEIEAQRISFVYGNTRLKDDRMTRETVQRASEKLRETADESPNE